mgnify:CR=1 FL=1
MITKETKQALVQKYAVSKEDTGSPEVQIMILSDRIKYLTAHLVKHKKDHSSRRGLLRMVSLRRRFITYVKRNNPKHFKKISQELNLS